MSDDRVYIGDEPNSENDRAENETSKLFVTLDGEQIEVDYSGNDSILETLLEAGHNPPYSCMDGNCMACMAKITEGRIYQEELGILTDENVEDREILTCQARPTSKIVKIDYDGLN